ncbi:MAG: hypothetical protein ACLUHE_15535 [Christensenellales bacterium]
MQDRSIEQRTRAAYRARACAAGVACGAQIFAVGTGLTVPLALNAAYGAAVPALLLVEHIGLAAPKRLSKAPGRAFCVVSWPFRCSFAALCCYAGATPRPADALPNGRLLTCLMLTLSFALLCALSSGTGVCRVAFALRWLLPAALAAFGGLSLLLLDGWTFSAAWRWRPLLGLSGTAQPFSLFARADALSAASGIETLAPVPKGGFSRCASASAACSAR